MNSFDDFRQLIEDSSYNGYQVCFEQSSIVKDNWSAANYFEYLVNIEHHKEETKIETSYELIIDEHNSVRRVNVTLHFPEYKGARERTDFMRWIVVPKRCHI